MVAPIFRFDLSSFSYNFLETASYICPEVPEVTLNPIKVTIKINHWNDDLKNLFLPTTYQWGLLWKALMRPSLESLCKYNKVKNFHMRSSRMTLVALNHQLSLRKTQVKITATCPQCRKPRISDSHRKLKGSREDSSLRTSRQKACLWTPWVQTWPSKLPENEFRLTEH